MTLTAAATLAFDLVTAVIVGLLVAGVLAIRAVANTARIRTVGLEVEPDPAGHSGEEQALLAEHIVAYRIDGPLFFAVAHRFLLELTEVTGVSVVILRMSRITTVDATGARVLGDAIARLEHRGITVLVSGIRPGHDQALDTLGGIARLRGQHRVFDSTPQAIAAARARLHSDGILPAPRPEAGDQPLLARV
jgi:SulP family sulfate permease